MIRKLSDPISPLERNPQSPKGWKNRESDCIGLRIVLVDSSSELQKGSDTIKYHNVSDPISIGVNKRGGFGCDWRCCDEGRSEKHGGFFCGSPAMESKDLSGYRIADFLSFCYLCRKRLDGKDIYMYRGEKAFCSAECRYQQIVSDEFHENCGSEALRSSDASRSSYTDDRLFFTGVAAA